MRQGPGQARCKWLKRRSLENLSGYIEIFAWNNKKGNSDNLRAPSALDGHAGHPSSHAEAKLLKSLTLGRPIHGSHKVSSGKLGAAIVLTVTNLAFQFFLWGFSLITLLGLCTAMLEIIFICLQTTWPVRMSSFWFVAVVAIYEYYLATSYSNPY